MKQEHIKTDGTVWTKKKGWNTGSITNCGYCIVYDPDIKKSELVHRLIATKYIPNPHNYSDVNHIDGNKTNNDVSNLEWVTHSQNILHALANNPPRKAQCDRLSVANVVEIKKLLKDKVKQQEIAEIFNTTVRVISGIKVGTTYKYVEAV